MTVHKEAEEKNTKEKGKGVLFSDSYQHDAYKLAVKYAGKDGKIAAIPDVVNAKLHADKWGPLWAYYTSSTSGEFWGKSKAGNQIIVIGHGIDKILQDERIMRRSLKNLRENSAIQLTAKEFYKLADGFYCPVEIIDYKPNNLNPNEPYDILTFNEAISNKLLVARLGPDAKKFLERHKQITLEESKNDYIIENKHEYQDFKKPKNEGGLLTLQGLVHASGWCRKNQPMEAVMSSISVSDLTCGGRFIAMKKGENLTDVFYFDSVFEKLKENPENLLVPNTNKTLPKIFGLIKEGNQWFTQYPKEGARLDTGIPQFIVKNLKPINGADTFETTVGGYHGFFKYDIQEVLDIAPKDANAYLMGEPFLIDGARKQRAGIEFFKADIDTSQRILREEEVKGNMNLIRKLIAA